MIERRPIWTGGVLAGYIREELEFPGARQAAMVERVRVDIATGEVTREGRYLLTSLSPRKCEPRELLRLFRNHWSIENSQRHVKDRSWEEDVPTLRRPGLGEVSAALVNTGLNALRLLGWFPGMVSMPGCPCPCEPNAAPSSRCRPSNVSTDGLPDFAIVPQASIRAFHSPKLAGNPFVVGLSNHSRTAFDRLRADGSTRKSL